MVNDFPVDLHLVISCQSCDNRARDRILRCDWSCTVQSGATNCCKSYQTTSLSCRMECGHVRLPHPQVLVQGRRNESLVHIICSHMRQVPLVTCILLRCTKITINFCLPVERPHWRVVLPVRHIRVFLKSRTISLSPLLLRSRRSVNFKEKDCIIHMLQHLAWTEKCMDHSCKCRAEWLCWSLVYQTMWTAVYQQE